MLYIYAEIFEKMSSGGIEVSFSIDQEIFLNLYKSLVRPHLEMSFQYGLPFIRKTTYVIIENQRLATKLVSTCTCNDLPYT